MTPTVPSQKVTKRTTRRCQSAILTKVVHLVLIGIACGAPSLAQKHVSDPNAPLAQIESLISQNRMEEARARTMEELGRNPSNVDAYNLLGMIQANLQDFQGAEESFKKALQLKPSSTRARNNLGGLYAAEKKADLAEKEFREVLKEDPANRDAHYNLGVLLMLKGAPALAVAQFQQVHPADPPTRLQLVRAYFASKQTALALREAATLSSEQEKNVQVHFSLGVLLASEKQYKPAQLELEKADALQPGTFEILFNLGEDLYRSGDLGAAQAVLARALRARPDSPETLYLMAQVDVDQSRPLDALDLLIRARKADPQNIDIVFLMARISMSQDYFEDAIPLLESGLKSAPSRPDLLAALGESYFMAGQSEKSIEIFNKLIEVEGSARSYAFLGLSYRNLGRFDEAIQQFQQGLKLDPKNALCLFNLGYIAARQGDAAGAETYLQKALQLKPDFADALLELANLRIAAQKRQEAAELLRHYVKVSRDPATGYYKLAMIERALHDTAAAERDLAIFKNVSRSAPSLSGPFPYQHLFDFLDNRSQLAASDRRQLDISQLTERIKQHPDQAEDLYLLAEAYLSDGKLENAKDTVAQLDKASDGDYRTLTGTGVLLARYHLYDAAIEHFQAALKINPKADDVRFDLADALFRAHQYPQALEAATQVSPEGQKDEAYLALLGDIYAHTGDTQRASAIYRDAIARNPDNDQDYLSLSLIQLRVGDRNSAKETLLKAQQRVPGSGKIYWGLGLLSAADGNDAQAAQQFERAVDLLPEWPGGYSTLGVFYFQSGQFEKAKEVLNRFKNSTVGGALYISRIEQALDQAAASPNPHAQAMNTEAREQFLRIALSLADRTL
ncbi:tetratricopeptide repeat protein [Acidobacteria bacterium AB60]|nr:tetratricopeptide repeat protein [Acidobacteria bacterium AB60]